MTYPDPVPRPPGIGWGIALLGALLILSPQSCAPSTLNSTPSPLAPVPVPAGNLQAGREAYERGDDVAALREIGPLAEQGDAEAQLLLGDMYEAGRGVPQDYDVAVEWWAAAAAQGYPLAQYFLPLETWNCFQYSSDEEPLLTLYRLRGDVSGRVSVAGVTHRASFRIAGLDRRWNFPSDADALLAGGVYPYAFIIKPDGSGMYFDFTLSEDGTASSRATYTCRSS